MSSSPASRNNRAGTVPRSNTRNQPKRTAVRRAQTLENRQTTSTDNEPSFENNPELIKRTLKNFNIRFTGCTFTYKSSHIEAVDSNGNSSARRPRFSLRRRITETIDRVLDIAPEQKFEKCVFVPTNEKDLVQEFIRKRFSNIQISFENCRFIKRSSTFSEKIKRNLRKVFGIMFEVDYVFATALVDQYKFRIKDIPVINQYLQERIAE